MGYKHGFTSADEIVKTLATVLSTGDELNMANNWELVFPATLAEISTGTLESNIATLKVTPTLTKEWVKREPKTITTGSVTLDDSIADGGGTRVFVRDKKYYLYLKKDAGALDVMEYRVLNNNTLEFNAALEGKQILVDYEKATSLSDNFFVRLEKPATTEGMKTNHYYIKWKIGKNYDEMTDSFPADMSSKEGKISFFKETDAGEAAAKGWLPIEYWISFDLNAGVGVLMGDPGLSNSEWLSSPFYFGSVEQIEGALETDRLGNFAGFGGSFYEPVLAKDFGDYTGTGVTDVIMASSKSGRPYQAHKISIFGGYEFREKTFNGQSQHTGKHAVSDIVIMDVHENDRGIMKHCLAVPRVAKEHGTELIYNRYISGEEQTYIFLNINAPFTPFNTSPDSLIGFAIRIDI